MSRKITIKEINDFLDGTGSTLRVKEQEYKNSKERLEGECLNCSREFFRSWGSLRASNTAQCMLCSDKSNIKKTPEQFKQETESKYPDLEVVGTYQGDAYKVEIRYKLCGCIVKRHAGALSQRGAGKDCPHHTEGYGVWETSKNIQDRLDTLPDGKLTILGVYNGSTKKSKFQCKVCRHVFDKIGHYVITSKGKCPNCSKTNNSAQHLFLGQVLADLGFSFKREFKLGEFRFDYYLPERNLLIEYDGVQHFRPSFNKLEFERTQARDKLKEVLAKDLGFNLLRIDHTEKVIIKLLEYLESSTTIETTPKGGRD